MRHASRASLLAVLLALALAPAASAARPEKLVFDFGDPDVIAGEAAWASALCGFPVEVHLQGHVISTFFPGTSRMLEIHRYSVRGSYSANGNSVSFVDAGPDRVYIADGHIHFAITGRSTTGSGWVGLTIFDIETGDLVHQSGNEVGVIYDTLCELLSA